MNAWTDGLGEMMIEIMDRSVGEAMNGRMCGWIGEWVVG